MTGFPAASHCLTLPFFKRASVKQDSRNALYVRYNMMTYTAPGAEFAAIG